MKFLDHGNSVGLWLSARDTYFWATQLNNSWPCSQLSGHRLFAAFDRNGLYELTIDGRNKDCDVNELNAITSDYLAKLLKPNHEVYFVTVGQFQTEE